MTSGKANRVSDSQLQVMGSAYSRLQVENPAYDASRSHEMRDTQVLPNAVMRLVSHTQASVHLYLTFPLPLKADPVQPRRRDCKPKQLLLARSVVDLTGQI